MSVGLFDLDMEKYCPVPFNLELMKLSSYYKKKQEIVSLSPAFSPNMYTQFIVRKDYYDGSFPKELLSEDNISYGGLAFSHNKYIPLDEAVERQKPDVLLYEKIRDKFQVNNRMKALFSVMSRAQHLRLSLDEKTLWEQFSKQLDDTLNPTHLFLHDYNLQAIKDSDLAIREIINQRKRKKELFLCMKFPVKVDNVKDLERWCSFPSSGDFFSLRYCGLFNDEELYELLLRGLINNTLRKIEYDVTKNCKDEKDFIDNYLLKIYHQVIFFRMFKIKILLIYDNDFFVRKEWERLIQFFNCYINTAATYSANDFDLRNKYDSLYSFAFHIKEQSEFNKDIFLKQEVRDLFNLVRENNYEVFKEFYDCHSVILKGGKFINASS